MVSVHVTREPFEKGSRGWGGGGDGDDCDDDNDDGGGGGDGNGGGDDSKILDFPVNERKEATVELISSTSVRL